MNRLLPVVLLLFICFCIVLILALPGTFWGLILKGFFGLCVLVLFKVAYNKMVLPGTCISAVFFTLAWWYAPEWPMYIFIALMLGALIVTCKTAEAFYNVPNDKR